MTGESFGNSMTSNSCAQWFRGSEIRLCVEKNLFIWNSGVPSSTSLFNITYLPSEIRVASMFKGA